MVKIPKHATKGLKKVSDKNLKIDIQIAAGMGTIALLSQEGMQALQQVLQGANDPVKALATALFMDISKVKTTLEQKGIDVDSRIWIMGGGVLDRILFEVMLAIATVLKYPDAQNSQFVHEVKVETLELMDQADDNSKAIHILHKKGLPIPKGPPQGGSQGLAAPQAPDQAQPQMGGMPNG